jgi:Tol biopolymer transport system component
MDFIIRNKKIFLIVGFVLFVVLMGYLMYALFFKPAVPIGPEEPGPEEPDAPGGLPTAQTGEGRIAAPQPPSGLPGIEEPEPEAPASRRATGGITQTSRLTDYPAINPAIDTDGKNIKFYNQDENKFYRIDEQGNLEELSDKKFYNVEKVTWSPDQNRAIIEYPDGSNITYDFDAEKQITLPKHWQEFNYASKGNQIVTESIALNPENNWLAIANDDGSYARPIEQLGNNSENVIPSWSPNDQIIAMVEEGESYDRKKVYFVGKHGENFKSITIEGRGFQPLWTPEGDRLLYSVYSSSNEYKPNLWIVDAEGKNIGNNRKNLSLETWAEKCSFKDNETVYCAVPESLPKGAGAFKELAEDSTDRLFQINIKTGVKSLVAIPDNNYQMQNLIISEDGKVLFFTDAKTNQLHKINL